VLNEVLNALETSLNALVDAVETYVDTVLEVYEAVITGDWAKLADMALDAALNILGIDPDEFRSYLAKAEGTVEKIVDDPMGFVSNLVDGVAKGFQQFGGNFLDHVVNGFTDWMTGQLSSGGITLPEEWNLAGVFDLALQICGINEEYLRGKAEQHLGEENMARVDRAMELGGQAVDLFTQVWGYLETAWNEGPQALWAQFEEYMGGLWEDTMGALQSWLLSAVVEKAATKIATLFVPGGALVQLLLTAWDVIQWLQENAQRIWSVFTSVVDAVSDIANGNLQPAADGVENALAGMIPPAIDLLAQVLGLDGLGDKIREILAVVHEKVDKAIDKVIEKVKDLGGRALTMLPGNRSQEEAKENQGEHKAESEARHESMIDAALDRIQAVYDAANTPRERLEKVENLLGEIKSSYDGELEKGVKFEFSLDQKGDDQGDARDDFELSVAIRPNDSHDVRMFSYSAEHAQDGQTITKLGAVDTPSDTDFVKRYADAITGTNKITYADNTQANVESHHTPPKGVAKWLRSRARKILDSLESGISPMALAMIKNDANYKALDKLRKKSDTFDAPHMPAISVHAETHIKKDTNLPANDANRFHWGSATAETIGAHINTGASDDNNIGRRQAIQRRRSNQATDDDRRQFVIEIISDWAEEEGHAIPNGQFDSLTQIHNWARDNDIPVEAAIHRANAEWQRRLNSQGISTQFYMSELDAHKAGHESDLETENMRDDDMNALEQLEDAFEAMSRTNADAFMQAHIAVKHGLQASTKDGSHAQKNANLKRLQTMSHDYWNTILIPVNNV